MFDGMTEPQIRQFIADQIIGHILTNPGIPTGDAINDVVAWFSIQYRVEKTSMHAMMAVFLNKAGAWFAEEAKLRGIVVE